MSGVEGTGVRSGLSVGMNSPTVRLLGQRRRWLGGDAEGQVSPPAYVEKYREHIERLGSEPEPFGRLYSTPIRITPTRRRVYH